MAKYQVTFTKDVFVNCHKDDVIDRAWEELEHEWRANKDNRVSVENIDFDNIQVEEV